MAKMISHKTISLLMVLVMVISLLPATAFATEAEYVYISASEDDQYISDASGSALAYTAVSLDDLAAIDLNEYGLSDYLYDEDGDGNYEVTALHLYIYTHEVLLGRDWNSEVSISGSPASIYFAGGLFGYSDENLRYNYNGAYPADENGWGFTADRIVLSDGDFLEVAHFEDWMFYADSAYGFHYFADSNDGITLEYTAETGSALSVKLIRVGGGMGSGDTAVAETGYTVYYGQSIGNAIGEVTTDGSGCASIIFPAAGTWYVWCDGGEGIDNAAGAIVSTPASAVVTVTAPQTEEPSPDESDKAQDVSEILNATMAQLAATVTEPVFGTTAGEWTVLCLARGGYYEKDNAYFIDYYDRIVETVNTKAASVSLANGALHKSKSTDNSRLIVALSSIGKNATSVGDWNLVTPYEDFSWIKNQGINGVIWTLIALDTNNYQTVDTTIRQQCIDHILSLQLEDGGWALSGTVADPDITGMTLLALYNYRDQEAVATAAEEGFACLSNIQNENGTYSSGGSETSESCAQVIVACTTWGINPDTDSRFIKNGISVVDALLTHYVEEEAMFEHIVGAGSNAMATDQACYALISYDRLVNGQTALYDMSDVTFDSIDSDVDSNTSEMTATLGVPAEIEGTAGTSFNAVISIDKWDNEAGYKLIDFIMTVPDGLTVTSVTAGSRLSGGEVSYNVEELEDGTGKLRVVYFDANENNTLEISGTEFPTEVFIIGFQLDEDLAAGTKLDFAITGMSVKLNSDSEDEASMVIVNTTNSDGTSVGGSTGVVTGVSFSAVCLYTGDDVDLIPSAKMAVAVAITGISNGSKLSYNDGTNEIEFKYSAEITAKTGVSTYVALVDSTIAMENFVNKDYFTITSAEAEAITFADANGDGVINAQDALAAVDAWLRKGEEPADDEILVLNVNGDSRINTFDALGIVEAFVNGSDYNVVTKAATLATAN